MGLEQAIGRQSRRGQSLRQERCAVTPAVRSDLVPEPGLAFFGFDRQPPIEHFRANPALQVLIPLEFSLHDLRFI